MIFLIKRVPPAIRQQFRLKTIWQHISAEQSEIYFFLPWRFLPCLKSSIYVLNEKIGFHVIQVPLQYWMVILCQFVPPCIQWFHGQQRVSFRYPVPEGINRFTPYCTVPPHVFYQKQCRFQFQRVTVIHILVMVYHLQQLQSVFASLFQRQLQICLPTTTIQHQYQECT